MSEDQVIVYAGVDTHRDVHVAAVVDTAGRVLATSPFPTDETGYEQLKQWLRSQGHIARVGVEGTGSYGAGLARYLTEMNIGWKGPRGKPAQPAAATPIGQNRHG